MAELRKCHATANCRGRTSATDAHCRGGSIFDLKSQILDVFLFRVLPPRRQYSRADSRLSQGFLIGDANSASRNRIRALSTNSSSLHSNDLRPPLRNTPMQYSKNP